MKTIEELIDKHYDELFDEICKLNDDLYELVIEYKEASTGKMIRRSWLDRDKMLKEEEHD